MFTWGEVCKHTVFFTPRASQALRLSGSQAASSEFFAQFVHSDMQRTASGCLVSRRVTRGQIAQSVHSVQGGRAISWP